MKDSKSTLLNRARLNERDFKILMYLHENRFATANRIGKRFWGSMRARNFATRLRTLKAESLVRSYEIDASGLLVYTPTNKATLILMENGYQPSPHFKSKPVTRLTFHHDEKLQDLREIIEKSPIVENFVPEHHLRVELAKRHGAQTEPDTAYKVPDGLFELKAKAKQFRVALELELSPKNAEKTRSMLRLHSFSPDYDLIFFVVATEYIHQRLASFLKELREEEPSVRETEQDKGFYFVTLKDFLSRGLNAVFYGEDTKFSLRSFEKK